MKEVWLVFTDRPYEGKWLEEIYDSEEKAREYLAFQLFNDELVIEKHIVK